MRTTDGFYAAASYFNPTDSVAAILCERLSLCTDLALETSSLTDTLPHPILSAEVQHVVRPENAFDLQAYQCIDGVGWIMMNADQDA